MKFVAQPVVSVLELFSGPLAGARFGDVDQEALAQLAANVEHTGIEVTTAEAKLAELRLLLATEQGALLALAQRALAYARVYAESHEELATTLHSISLPRPTKARKASAVRSSDLESAPVEATAVGAAFTPSPTPIDGREVELDPEPCDVEEVRVPNTRKPRRNRSSAAELHSPQSEAAIASE
jgi:hypothetical protein